MVRGVLSRHRGHEVKTTGDGFLISFDAAGRGLRCATEVVARAKGLGIELRAGLHCGDVEVRGDDIGGIPVNIAKRLCDLASPGEVLASEAVRLGMMGSAVQFADRGEADLKGVPGTWRLYAITADPAW
jgi:class 3 adenylate cyclase